MVHDSMSLCCILCLMFYFCPLFVSLRCSFLYVLPSVFSFSSLHVCLCLSVSIVSFMLSPLCLSLIISRVLLPPLSPPVPRSLISVSVYLSFGFPRSLCQFVAGVWVMSPSSSLGLMRLQSLFWILIFLFCIFDFNFAFWLYSVLVQNFFGILICSLGFCCSQLLLNTAHLLFPRSCLPWVCIWVHLFVFPLNLDRRRCFGLICDPGDRQTAAKLASSGGDSLEQSPELQEE